IGRLGTVWLESGRRQHGRQRWLHGGRRGEQHREYGGRRRELAHRRSLRALGYSTRRSHLRLTARSSGSCCTDWWWPPGTVISRLFGELRLSASSRECSTGTRASPSACSSSTGILSPATSACRSWADSIRSSAGTSASN